MKLSALTTGLGVIRRQGADVDVSDIRTDSRAVTPGCAFVAVRGAAADGHRFIAQALANGAAALIVDDDRDVPADIPCVVLQNTRTQIGPLAARFFGEPSRAMTVVGITGTNGKTSTTYIAEAILNKHGYSVGVIGTVNYRFAGQIVPAPTTTPGPVDLQRMLAKMRDAGVTHVLMEVSSHALDQHRVDGTVFGCGVFTNLTRDHLDYHSDMGSYLAAKRRLFVPLLNDSPAAARTAVINADDPVHKKLVDGFTGRVLTFSLTDPSADLAVTRIDVDLAGTRLVLAILGETVAIDSPLPGKHNAQNIMQAIGIALHCGLSAQDAAAAVNACQNIPGRLERVADPNGAHIFVDYSHTPDALQQVAAVLNALKGAHRQIIVFGAGGDRDPGKRPLMGEAAGRLADIAVITSDNPRTEDPDAIIAQIEPGCVSAGKRKADATTNTAIAPGDYVVVPGRRAAIRLAVAIAQPGDAVLIAGKGHEDYQIIGTTKTHFDDREEAAAAVLEKQRGGGHD